MTTALRTAAVAVLLAGPTVLAFRAGGYFDEPRVIAAVVAWALVALAALVAPVAVPRAAPARLALGGLAALTAVVGASLLWAPIGAFAQADLQRLLLYLAALVAGTAFLRRPAGLRVVEVALAAGTLVVVAYALSGRLLPGIVEQTVSSSAGGRLEQPLTYWNAVGALAALGTVLCTRIAGDATRDGRLRVAAAAGAVPLGLAMYLTLSRGALLTTAFGLFLLVALGRERSQLRSIGVVVVAVLVACLATAVLPAVRGVARGMDAREAQGLVMLAVLVVLAAGAALAQHRLLRRPQDAPLRGLRLVTAACAIAVVAAFAVAATGDRSVDVPAGGTSDARRLTTIESNRYTYWRVAGEMFARAPLIGEGSGAFRVVWRRDRTIDDPALDAHSLYVETAAELGLLGLLALGLFIAGVWWSAARALARDRAAAVGPVAAVAALAVHAGLDWDWEMPALALLGILLAAALAAAADEPGEPPGAAPGAPAGA
jgi:hypothetical protein